MHIILNLHGTKQMHRETAIHSFSIFHDVHVHTCISRICSSKLIIYNSPFLGGFGIVSTLKYSAGMLQALATNNKLTLLLLLLAHFNFGTM